METFKGLDKDGKIKLKIDPELADLIPGFLKNRETDIQMMLEALPKQGFEIIQRIGHGMKGAGAGFGFEKITEIGAFLEQAAKDKNPEKIKKGIDELANYVKRIEVTYE